MKKILFLLTAIFLSTSVFPQVVEVRNSETGEPLELVNIKCEFENVLAASNKNGNADLSAFAGAKKITFRLVGFKSESFSFEELKNSNFRIYLISDPMQMSEIVVSATRWNQKISDLPIKIFDIQKMDVENYNPQTAADLLAVSSKVFIQKSQQGGGSPMIRGFATNRLLYSVDGVRMNTAIFRSGNIQNVISLDPFAIEKTEILFGANSVIYGSDAIGGIMSFQTLTPEFSLKDDWEIKANSVMRTSSANNEKTAHINLNFAERNLGIIFSATTFNYDDLKIGKYGSKDFLRNFFVKRINGRDSVINNSNPLIQTPSGYSQLNLMQKIRYVPADKFEIQFATHYSATSNYSRYDRHLRTKKNLPSYGQWDYGPQKWLMNNLYLLFNDENYFFNEMSLRTAWQIFDESRISRNFNSYEKQIRTEKVNAYSVNLDFNKSISNLRLFYGIELVYNDVISVGTNKNIQTGSVQKAASRYPKSNWGSYAGYISSNYNLTDKIIFQSGIRFNVYSLRAKFDSTFYPFPFSKANLTNSSLTWNVGALFKVSDDLLFTINLSSAFRSPNVDDIGKIFDSEPGMVVVPNPKLESEYAYNVDLGMVKYFGSSVKFDVNFFYTFLVDAIVRRDFQLNGKDSIYYDGSLSKVQALQNAANAKVWGVQTGLEIKFLKNLSFVSDLSFQKGEEETDDGTISPSRHAAPLFGSAKIVYSRNKFMASLYLLFSDSKNFNELPLEEKAKTEIYATDKNGNPYSPAWYTLNLKLNFEFFKDMKFGLGLENISDQRYKTYSSGIAAPGRNFILSISYSVR